MRFMIRKICYLAFILASVGLIRAQDDSASAASNMFPWGNFESGSVFNMPWTGNRNGNVGLDLNQTWRSALPLGGWRNSGVGHAVGPDGFLLNENERGGLLVSPGVDIGDLDGDGLGDLVVVDAIGRFFFFKNIGNDKEPKFGRAEVMPIYLGGIQMGNGPWSCEWDSMVAPRLQITDVDGDGSLDLIIGDFYGKCLFLRNQGSKTKPKFPETLGYFNNACKKYEIKTDAKDREWLNYLAPAYHDMDGDGKKDLVIGEGTYSANSVYFLKNKGSDTTPQLLDRAYMIRGLGRQYLVPRVVDWNGDGKPDVVIGEWEKTPKSSTGNVTVHINESKGPEDIKSAEDLKFTEAQPIGSIRFPGRMVCPAFYDLNGDGLPDMVFTCAAMENVFYSINVGKKEGWKFDSYQALKSADTTPKIVTNKGIGPDGFSGPAGLRFGFTYFATRNPQYKSYYGYDPSWEPPQDSNEEVMKKNQSCLVIDTTPIKQEVFSSTSTFQPKEVNGVGIGIGNMRIKRGVRYEIRFDYKGDGIEKGTVNVHKNPASTDSENENFTVEEDFVPSNGWNEFRHVFIVPKGDSKSDPLTWRGMGIGAYGMGKLMIDNLSVKEAK